MQIRHSDVYTLFGYFFLVFGGGVLWVGIVNQSISFIVAGVLMVACAFILAHLNEKAMAKDD